MRGGGVRLGIELLAQARAVEHGARRRRRGGRATAAQRLLIPPPPARHVRARLQQHGARHLRGTHTPRRFPLRLNHIHRTVTFTK